MEAIPPAQLEAIRTATQSANQRSLEPATIAACRAPHRFEDCFENLLTGIVITGVLLFAAGLLRYALPVCTARIMGADALDALAIASGGLTTLMTLRGMFAR
jgi:hypothetical protein